MPVVGLIRFDGYDNDYCWFTQQSWTTPGVEYTQDICKRTGIMSCSCMDSVCRHKRDRIHAKQPRLCKHCLAVLRWIDQLTGEQTT